MIDAKLSLTTACGAKCATCPAWKRPANTMDTETFVTVWQKLNDSPLINRILINGTGDITAVKDWHDFMEGAAVYKRKFVTMTTNAAHLDYIPGVLDELIISFNGGTPETYKKTTGLSFEKVSANIRKLYPDIAKLKNAEIHCLIWDGNEDDAEKFAEHWADFPGRRRISYKVENQNREYFGKADFKDDNRIPCDYLTKLCVEWDGRVSACNHDWNNLSSFGNLKTDDVLYVMNHPERRRMMEEHSRGEFKGICESCNYNVTDSGKVVYV